MRYGIKCGSNCGCHNFLYEKQTVKRSVQRHVLAQSQPGRRPTINIQSTLRTAPDLCKNVSLLCYLVATVIHIQSVCSQVRSTVQKFPA